MTVARTPGTLAVLWARQASGPAISRRAMSTTTMRATLVACIVAMAITGSASAQQASAADTHPRLRNADDLADALTDSYPETLRRSAIGGTTRVRLEVNGRGEVRGSFIAASSGLLGLDDAALRTAREAEFEVPRDNGEAAEYWTELPFTFRTGDEKDPEAQVIPLVNREEVARELPGMALPSLATARIGAAVGFAVLVDSAGRPTKVDVLDTSCFTEADLRAAEIVHRLAFEPATTPALRRTYASVLFGLDSVIVRLTGDAFLPPPRDSAADTTHTARTHESKMPSLRNRGEIARALERFYPPDLRDEGIGGQTLIMLKLDAEGNVLFRQVTASSGICRIDAVALLVTERMRFEPAIGSDGKPIGVFVEIPIAFSSR